MTDHESARPIQLPGATDRKVSSDNPFRAPPLTDIRETDRKSARPNQLPGATEREVSSDNPFDAPPLTDIHHPSLTLESKLSTYSLLPYSDPPTTCRKTRSEVERLPPRLVESDPLRRLARDA